MTAKSRARKRKIVPVTEKNYKFATNKKDIVIRAESLNQARMRFMEKYGYWPEKEITDD